MANFMLTCCSTADMSKEYFAARDVRYVCFHYNMDGTEYSDDLGETMSSAEFYRRIDQGAMPTTSQVNVEQYTAFWEPMLAAGQDVLHLTLSSGISGSYNSATIAARELAARYPARKLYVVDSLAASSGYGMVVDLAVGWRDEGVEIDALRDRLEATKKTVQHWFFSTNLTHFKRGGRISAPAAMAGSLLHLCPLMNVDAEGKLQVRKKIRGKANAKREIVDKMRELANGHGDYAGRCFICHSACFADAREVADSIEANFPRLEGKVVINDIGAVIGAHTGPGTVAVFFVGEERVD